MNLRLVNRCSTGNAADLFGGQLPLFSRLVEGLGRPEWFFDLVLVDDSVMADLNSKFRGKEGVTDVLSFANLLTEGDRPCDLPGREGHAFSDLWVDDFSRLPSGDQTIQIGEVILAPVFVVDRCLENQWSVPDELALLVVHGVLHLLGWDHQTPAETRKMQELEGIILAACALPHPLRKEERPEG